jgi:hypothetical protein
MAVRRAFTVHPGRIVEIVAASHVIYIGGPRRASTIAYCTMIVGCRGMSSALVERMRVIVPYRYRGELRFKLKRGARVDPAKVFEEHFAPELWVFRGKPHGFFESMPWFLDLDPRNSTQLLDRVEYMAHSEHAASPVYILSMPDGTHVLRIETHRLGVLQEELANLAKLLASRGRGYRFQWCPVERGGPVGEAFEYSLVSNYPVFIDPGLGELRRKEALFAVQVRPSFASLYVYTLSSVGLITVLVRIAPDFYAQWQAGTPAKALAGTVLAVSSAAVLALALSTIRRHRGPKYPTFVWHKSKE